MSIGSRIALAQAPLEERVKDPLSVMLNLIKLLLQHAAQFTINFVMVITTMSKLNKFCLVKQEDPLSGGLQAEEEPKSTDRTSHMAKFQISPRIMINTRVLEVIREHTCASVKSIAIRFILFELKIQLISQSMFLISPTRLALG